MPAFEKVGECLHRHVSTGKYYDRFEFNEREVRKPLGAIDRHWQSGSQFPHGFDGARFLSQGEGESAG